MKAIWAILAVALVTATGWLLFKFGISLYDLYNKADAAVKLSVLTAGGSVAAFIINNAVQSSRERRARLFESKRTAYEEFFKFFFLIFASNRTGEVLDDNVLVERFSDFTRSVMVWGSSATIKALLDFQRQTANNSDGSGMQMFRPTENLLRALRKDLGHSDGSLEVMALTKLIVKTEDHDQLPR